MASKNLPGPSVLQKWSTDEVTLWLRAAGYGEFVLAFKGYRCDGVKLLTITEQEINSMNHQFPEKKLKSLLKQINKSRNRDKGLLKRLGSDKSSPAPAPAPKDYNDDEDGGWGSDFQSDGEEDDDQPDYDFPPDDPDEDAGHWQPGNSVNEQFDYRLPEEDEQDDLYLQPDDAEPAIPPRLPVGHFGISQNGQSNLIPPPRPPKPGQQQPSRQQPPRQIQQQIQQQPTSYLPPRPPKSQPIPLPVEDNSMYVEPNDGDIYEAPIEEELYEVPEDEPKPLPEEDDDDDYEMPDESHVPTLPVVEPKVEPPPKQKYTQWNPLLKKQPFGQRENTPAQKGNYPAWKLKNQEATPSPLPKTGNWGQQKEEKPCLPSKLKAQDNSPARTGNYPAWKLKNQVAPPPLPTTGKYGQQEEKCNMPSMINAQQRERSPARPGNHSQYNLQMVEQSQPAEDVYEIAEELPPAQTTRPQMPLPGVTPAERNWPPKPPVQATPSEVNPPKQWGHKNDLTPPSLPGKRNQSPKIERKTEAVDNIPQWKKDLIAKKNKQHAPILDKKTEAADNVPQWKKNFIAQKNKNETPSVKPGTDSDSGKAVGNIINNMKNLLENKNIDFRTPRQSDNDVTSKPTFPKKDSPGNSGDGEFRPPPLPGRPHQMSPGDSGDGSAAAPPLLPPPITRPAGPMGKALPDLPKDNTRKPEKITPEKSRPAPSQVQQQKRPLPDAPAPRTTLSTGVVSALITIVYIIVHLS
uniref:Titin-like n=1 Tax=Saccoglossus kowalevskii TaxID=10224 RepID=A0ABM0MJ53_SACKO|nr:PREDICTED: titin-like [Saccoglossus kowalevskii]